MLAGTAVVAIWANRLFGVWGLVVAGVPGLLITAVTLRL
jgi:hypothetical protein